MTVQPAIAFGRVESVFLVDLDGVVRDWPSDGDGWGDYAVPMESIREALFDPALVGRAVTGAITDEEWRAEAAALLAKTWGGDHTERLAATATFPGVVNAEVLDLVRRVRQRSPVGVLTNATTRLADHLAQLGLTEEFDWIFNTCELGVAKPDPAVFEIVCERMGAKPGSVVFVDDTEAHVAAARSCGMTAYRFRTSTELEQTLRGHGLLK